MKCMKKVMFLFALFIYSLHGTASSQLDQMQRAVDTSNETEFVKSFGKFLSHAEFQAMGKNKNDNYTVSFKPELDNESYQQLQMVLNQAAKMWSHKHFNIKVDGKNHNKQLHIINQAVHNSAPSWSLAAKIGAGALATAGAAGAAYGLYKGYDYLNQPAAVMNQQESDGTAVPMMEPDYYQNTEDAFDYLEGLAPSTAAQRQEQQNAALGVLGATAAGAAVLATKGRFNPGFGEGVTNGLKSFGESGALLGEKTIAEVPQSKLGEFYRLNRDNAKTGSLSESAGRAWNNAKSYFSKPTPAASAGSIAEAEVAVGEQGIAAAGKEVPAGTIAGAEPVETVANLTRNQARIAGEFNAAKPVVAAEQTATITQAAEIMSPRETQLLERHQAKLAAEQYNKMYKQVEEIANQQNFKSLGDKAWFIEERMRNPKLIKEFSLVGQGTLTPGLGTSKVGFQKLLPAPKPAEYINPGDINYSGI